LLLLQRSAHGFAIRTACANTCGHTFKTQKNHSLSLTPHAVNKHCTRFQVKKYRLFNLQVNDVDWNVVNKNTVPLQDSKLLIKTTNFKHKTHSSYRCHLFSVLSTRLHTATACFQVSEPFSVRFRETTSSLSQVRSVRSLVDLASGLTQITSVNRSRSQGLSRVVFGFIDTHIGIRIQTFQQSMSSVSILFLSNQLLVASSFCSETAGCHLDLSRIRLDPGANAAASLLKHTQEACEVSSEE